MRIEGSVTSVSWIPSEAVTGAFKVPFTIGMAHYDEPPPAELTGFEALVQQDSCRFCNHLRAFIELEDGKVKAHGVIGDGMAGSTTLRLGPTAMTFAAFVFPTLRPEPVVTATSVKFVQTCGARTGVAAPRTVKRPPFFQLAAPTAWTTLELELHADGRCTGRLVGASPFPRHWLYDHQGKLFQKSSFIDFKTWSDEFFGDNTPWGAADSPALVSAVESALERQLSTVIMSAGAQPKLRALAPGEKLCEQGEGGEELYLLLDGVLEVWVDGRRVTEIGPGAVLGERALLEGGRRTSSLRALTRCKVACVAGDCVDRDKLQQLTGRNRESAATGAQS